MNRPWQLTISDEMIVEFKLVHKVEIKSDTVTVTVKLTVWTMLDDQQLSFASMQRDPMQFSFSRGLTIEWE